MMRGVQVSDTGIKHSFLVCGATTAIIGEDGAGRRLLPLQHPRRLRLPSGNSSWLSANPKTSPEAAFVELARDGKVLSPGRAANPK